MKSKILYNTLLIFLTMVYIIVIYTFNLCTINYHIVESIIVFVPLLLFIFFYFFLKKEKIKKWICNTVMVISAATFFMMILFTFMMICFDEGTSYEDDPLRYEHIRDIAGYAEYMYQFPEKISNDILQSNSVKFYYTPQFLQGAFNFGLLLNMEDKEIDDYISKYEDKVKAIIDMKETNVTELKKYVISEPYGVLEQEEFEEFVKNSKFYIFESEPYKEDDWNHGLMQYMAKNEESNQLLLVTKVW